MAAVLNGMSLVKVRPYGSGFLIFSDYMRGAIRLSALMELPVIYVFTHDSIGVGEDGPTHQPVEQLAAMRATPGLIVIRPADANEVRRPGRSSCNCTMSRPLSSSPARRCRRSTVRSTQRRRASRAAPMCSPMRPAASRM